MAFAFVDFSSAAAVWQVIATVLPVWFVGLLSGYFLPRSKLQTPSKSHQGASWALFLSAPSIRRFAVLYHLAVIIRDVWRTYTRPGTARAFFKALLSWLSGKGWQFDFPLLAAEDPVEDVGASVTTRDADNWYVTQKDLAFFQYHVEEEGEVPGASAWEMMMDKEIPNSVKYTAWRRTLPNGKTEYKSVTYSYDATAEEFTDLYFDDDFRPKWDSMIVHHEVVEHGDFAQRQQVVRWVRRFPFKFLSDREYTIARRMYKGADGALYGLTKVVDHPSSQRETQVVKMDVFHSMWRSRTVACPWGSGRPACETVLLHHEQFKINESLSRFAVRTGMWGFLKTLAERTPEYIARRRARGIPSAEHDPMAYGWNGSPGAAASTGASSSTSSTAAGMSPVRAPRMSAPGGAMATAGSMSLGALGGFMPASASCMSLASLESAGAGGCGSSLAGGGNGTSLSRQCSGALPARGRNVPQRVKGLLAVAVAGGLAVLFRRSDSMPNLAAAGGGGAAAGSVKALKQREQRERARMRRQASNVAF